jgi:hypothetical protein
MAVSMMVSGPEFRPRATLRAQPARRYPVGGEAHAHGQTLFRVGEAAVVLRPFSIDIDIDIVAAIAIGTPRSLQRNPA